MVRAALRKRFSLTTIQKAPSRKHRFVGMRLARRFVFGAYFAHPLCLRLRGRRSFGAFTSGWRAVTASAMDLPPCLVDSEAVKHTTKNLVANNDNYALAA